MTSSARYNHARSPSLVSAALFIIVVVGVGLAIGFVTRPGEWYESLAKPAFNPPGWVFGPVWTTLYALMAIAAWLVWREGGFRTHARALTLFLVQLAANALWSWLFFAWHRGGTAFAEVLVLWLLIVATLAAFWRVRALAGALLVPYLLWVSFASALTYTTWQLNPGLLGG